MIRNIVFVFCLLMLSGCAIFGEESLDAPQVIVTTECAVVQIYQPELPREMKLENVSFFVITEENLEQKKQEIERLLGGEFVVFAIVPQAYENLAYNMQEIQRYLKQQKEIILYYQQQTTIKKEEIQELDNGKTN
jgi:apolipoprotein N-acyltransferase